MKNMKRLRLRKEVKNSIYNILLVLNIFICIFTSNTFIGIITLINSLYFNFKSVEIEDKIEEESL